MTGIRPSGVFGGRVRFPLRVRAGRVSLVRDARTTDGRSSARVTGVP